MNTYFTSFSIQQLFMSTMGGDGDRGEVQQLREEVAALNGLLEESASALFALNETVCLKHFVRNVKN